jgi:hypothetical protein
VQQHSLDAVRTRALKLFPKSRLRYAWKALSQLTKCDQKLNKRPFSWRLRCKPGGELVGCVNNEKPLDVIRVLGGNLRATCS